MSDYVTEKTRRRFVVAAGLVVAGYCLQLSGTLQASAWGLDAVAGSYLVSNDLTLPEATVIRFSFRGLTSWMTLMAASSFAWMLLFAGLLAVSWRLLPRRATSALAAVGLVATFVFGLPLLAGNVAVTAASGKHPSEFVGSRPTQDAILPIGGGLPAFGLPLVTKLETAIPVIGEAGRTAAIRPSDMFSLLTSLAFWTVLIGLVATALPNRKGQAVAQIPA